jgi:hypothetical protein
MFIVQGSVDEGLSRQKQFYALLLKVGEESPLHAIKPLLANPFLQRPSWQQGPEPSTRYPTGRGGLRSWEKVIPQIIRISKQCMDGWKKCVSVFIPGCVAANDTQSPCGHTCRNSSIAGNYNCYSGFVGKKDAPPTQGAV